MTLPRQENEYLLNYRPPLDTVTHSASCDSLSGGETREIEGKDQGSRRDRLHPAVVARNSHSDSSSHIFAAGVYVTDAE